MIDNLPGFASVFGVAFLSLWASIPAGRALRLSPAAIIVTASLAYACGVAVVVLPGERVRDWLREKLGERATLRPDSLVGRAWARFGLPGLALLAPITVGAQVGAIIGLSLGASPRSLWLWMTLGAVVWSVILSVALSLGLMGLEAAA